MRREKMFDIPIALITYKRSENLLEIINELRILKASNIYVISDGPKNDLENDSVLKVRSLINEIDWETNLKKIYSATNLGLNSRIITGLNEVFLSEEKLIILEDDCIPNQSFFKFAGEMLEMYEQYNRVQLISGTNLGLKLKFEYDYDFVSYPLIWGWATWKSSWEEFVKTLPIKINDYDKLIMKKILNNTAYFHWNNLFSKIQKGTHSSWDHELAYFLFSRERYCIIPRVNLVRNVGIDEYSTNKLQDTKRLKFHNIRTEFISLDKKHPSKIELNKISNSVIEKKIFSGGFRSYTSYIVQSIFK